MADFVIYCDEPVGTDVENQVLGKTGAAATIAVENSRPAKPSGTSGALLPLQGRAVLGSLIPNGLRVQPQRAAKAPKLQVLGCNSSFEK